MTNGVKRRSSNQRGNPKRTENWIDSIDSQKVDEAALAGPRDLQELAG